MMKTTKDVKLGKLYWGNMPLPAGAELLGTVTRDAGETGALINMRGNLVQGNAGAIRSLPVRAPKQYNPARAKGSELCAVLQDSVRAQIEWARSTYNDLTGKI